MKSIGYSFVLAALLVTGCQKRVSNNEESDSPSVAVAPTPVPTPDYAPPGTFFLLTAIRKETKDGIIRLLPGTQVKLLRNGKYQTPEGEMALDSRNLTNDRTAARAAQSADSKGQVAARPKALVASYAPPASPMRQASLQASSVPSAPATTVPDSGTPDDKVRTMKFRLATLKSEEAKLQANVDYLWEKSARINHKMPGAPSGLSSSSSLGDYDTVTAKLAAVRAEISALEAKLQEAVK
jgi:hypothetical protein